MSPDLKNKLYTQAPKYCTWRMLAIEHNFDKCIVLQHTNLAYLVLSTNIRKAVLAISVNNQGMYKYLG